jgi:hypothetical protein
MSSLHKHPLHQVSCDLVDDFKLGSLEIVPLTLKLVDNCAYHPLLKLLSRQ